jgi:hypothetical protein
MRSALLLLLPLLLLAACRDTTAPPQVGAVFVSTPTLTLAVGDSAQLAAVVHSSAGAVMPNEPVTWSSSHEAVVSVSAAGLARAHAPGEAWLRASAGARADSVRMIVPAGVCTGVATDGSIMPGQSRAGTLTRADCVLPHGAHGDGYALVLGAPAVLRIELTSPHFDALVVVADTALMIYAFDDDGGAGTNARLETWLAAGTYVVWATSYFPGETGSYHLIVTELTDHPCAQSVGTLSLGQTVAGALAASDCLLRDRYHDRWHFQLESPQTVQLDLRSAQFDAFLFVTDAQGSVLVWDDDSGGGTDARIVQPFAAGEYTVWATSYWLGETGAYQLSALSVEADAGAQLAGAASLAPYRASARPAEDAAKAAAWWRDAWPERR